MKKENIANISVAIPCMRSHINPLKKALSNILQGSLIPEEVVVLISGITAGKDITPRVDAIEKEFSGKFKRFRLVRFYDKTLAYDARNRITPYLSNDLVVYHDADDIQHYNRLEIIERFFKENDIMHLCHSYYWDADNHTRSIPFDKIKRIDNLKTLVKQKPFAILQGVPAVRREVLDEIEWEYRESGEDKVFNRDTWKKYNKSLFINARLYHYPKKKNKTGDWL